MKYAMIGSGKIGSALARKFAQNNVEIGIANSRGPETLVSLKQELGSSIVPQSIQEAVGLRSFFSPSHSLLTRTLQSSWKSGTARL